METIIKPNKKYINLLFDVEILNNLSNVSKQLGITKTDFCRMAIVKKIREENFILKENEVLN